MPIILGPRRREWTLGSFSSVVESSENERVRLIENEHLETVLRLWCGGQNIADLEVLPLRVNLPRAWLAAVVEKIVAIPPRPAAPHLNEPGPDAVWRRGEDNTVGDLNRGVRNELIARKRKGLVSFSGMLGHKPWADFIIDAGWRRRGASLSSGCRATERQRR